MNFPEYLNKFLSDKSDLVQMDDRIFGLRPRIEEQKRDALNKTKKLLIVSGLPGAGKDSVVQELIKQNNDFGLIKTCTTRLRRIEETEENDPYIRLTEEQFRLAQKSGDVIESTVYAGGNYCSLYSVFKKAFDEYRFPILRIDPEGANFYTKLWRMGQGLFEDVSLIGVFVVAPSLDAQKNRVLNRSKDEELVKKRMAQTEIDLPHIAEAEYILINETGELELAVEEFYQIIK